MSRFGINRKFRGVLWIAAAFIGIIVAPANLTASKIGGAGASKNNVGDKTDFHLELGGSTKIDVTSATANGVAGTITDDNTTSPKIEWMLATKRGDTVNWKWAGTQPGDKNVSKQKPVFTPVGSPTDIAALGWNVEAGEVFLLNDFTAEIFFDNLLFQFPADFTADSLLDLALGPPVGVPGLLGSGIVPAGGQLKVGEFVLPLGSFLTFTYDASFVDPAFSGNTTRGAIGHEAAIPEPSTIALLGIAGLWLIRRGSGSARRD